MNGRRSDERTTAGRFCGIAPRYKKKSSEDCVRVFSLHHRSVPHFRVKRTTESQIKSHHELRGLFFFKYKEIGVFPSNPPCVNNNNNDNIIVVVTKLE